MGEPGGMPGTPHRHTRLKKGFGMISIAYAIEVFWRKREPVDPELHPRYTLGRM